jgi:hypothetical protein
MDINLPKNVRAAIYIITGIGSLIITYLAATGGITLEQVALWTGFTTFVGGLAKLNTPIE